MHCILRVEGVGGFKQGCTRRPSSRIRGQLSGLSIPAAPCQPQLPARTPPRHHPITTTTPARAITTMPSPCAAVASLLFVAVLMRGGAAGDVAITAADPLVDWAGRVGPDPEVAGAMRFDWLGVAARVAVQGATYVRVNVSSTSVRGTRLRAYAADQGFLLYPTVQVWAEGDPAFAVKTLWASHGPAATTITLENIVAPQYGTGMTRVSAFSTDGKFVALPAASRFGGAAGDRRIEFIGDSITAATNVARPPLAPSCGDGGYQSDWSQTYEAQLCHRFGASCSTVAVGGKCVMRECGGLQMPDYFLSQHYADAPLPTYNFSGGWAPDAVFINLGTNDVRAIASLGPTAGPAAFVAEFLVFMSNITQWYQHPTGIKFFVNAGPMENTTAPYTHEIVTQANALGMNTTFVDMSTACVAGDGPHQNADGCDGCASHPGINGHRYMYEAAWPVMAQVMGWD